MKEKERKGEMGEEERQGREGDCKKKKNALQLAAWVHLYVGFFCVFFFQ